jgi:hypothetical protein
MTKAQRAAIDEGIKNVGGLVKAAARFKVTIAAIGNWRTRGIPNKRLKEFSEVTGVSRVKLRPDLYA